MKKLFLLSLISLLSIFAQAKMVDGLACIVEGKCITTAEVHAVQVQMGVSKKEAMDLLIQDRLQKVAMSDIIIDEKTIDKKISDIAQQNNISVKKMQSILKQQGTPWTKYRESIRNALKKEKFYQEKIAANIPTPTDDELRIFYRNHKKSFTIPSSVSLIEYSGSTEAKMKKFLQTKNTKGIKSHTITKKTKDLNPTLLGTILNTQNDSYTRPFNAGDRYIVYKVLSKNGKMAMPFESAKGAVAEQWKQQQQNKALKDYFQKLKTNADIQQLR